MTMMSWMMMMTRRRRRRRMVIVVVIVAVVGHVTRNVVATGNTMPDSHCDQCKQGHMYIACYTSAGG